MYEKKWFLRLDVKKQYDNEVITMVKQDTYSNVLYIVLYNDSIKMEVSKTTIATVIIDKPDNTQVIGSAEVLDNGTLKYVVDYQALTALGMAKFTVKLIIENNILTTTSFVANVINDPFAGTDGSIGSTSEYPILTNLIHETTDILVAEETRVDNENQRLENEEIRIDNENERIENENIRKSNEITRQSNETTRQNNETNRTTKETERQTNETTRQNNESTRIDNENERIEAEQQRATTFAGYETRVSTVENELTQHKLDYVEQMDKLVNVKLSDWVVGGYSETGITTTNDRFIRQNEYIYANVNDLFTFTLSGYTMFIYRYDLNKTYIKSYGWISNYVVADEGFYRIAIYKTSGTMEGLDIESIGSNVVAKIYSQKPIRFLDDGIITSNLKTSLGESAFLYVTAHTSVKIDTIAKTLTIPASTRILWRGKFGTIWSETILDISTVGIFCGVYLNTESFQISVKSVGTVPKDIENEVAIGMITVNGSTLDGAFLNCNKYTVNGKTGVVADDSISASMTQPLNKQGFLITDGGIDFNLSTNVATITGNLSYLIYEDKMFKIPTDTTFNISTSNTMLAILFDVKNKVFKTAGVSSTDGVLQQLYGYDNSVIVLGILNRATKDINLNCNKYTVNRVGTTEYEYIPKYLKEEINRVSTKVAKIDSDITFSFATDVHLNKWADITYKMKVIGELGKTGLLDFNCLGGDIIDGGENKDANINRLIDGLKYSKDSFPTDLFICQGNHDTSWEAFYNETWGFGTPSPETVITPKNWHNIACRHLEGKVVFDDNNYYGGYYYKDFEKAKIRVIILNTSDFYELDVNGNPILNSMNGYLRQNQIDWLQNKALNFIDKTDKQNWGIVVISHMSIASGDMGGLAGRNTLAGILSAYVNGTSYSNTEQLTNYTLNADVDFTSQGAMEFICSVSGHVHWDRVYNIPIINRPAISVVNYKTAVDGTSLPEGATQPTERVAGELSGEAFDIFSIDRENRKIYATRFGAGNDRIIDY